MGNFDERPQTPSLNIKARAMVNAPVANAKCLISVLEKCQIDPLWIEIGSFVRGSPKKLDETLPSWPTCTK